ncbi:MAG: hypothetical protein ACREH3_13560, partial [Geminicoccales bacterium]
EMDSTGAKLRRPYYLGLLADALREAGEREEAAALVDEALAVVETSGERWWAAELYRLKATLPAAIPARRDAEVYLRKATEIAQALAARALELRAKTGLARLWAEQGKRRKAHDLLAPTYGWFTEGFDTQDLKDAKALLDQLG